MCKLIQQITTSIKHQEEMQVLHSQTLVETDSDSDDSSSLSSISTTEASASDTNAVAETVAETVADVNADTTEESNKQQNKVKKSVRFSSIAIRKYDKTLGDNPSCTDGCPTTLDWTYSVQPVVSIDEYETNRLPRRIRRHLVLTSITRRNSMFYHFGFSHEEIDEAAKSIKKFQKQRQDTKKLSKKQEKTQEIVQKVTRNLKRIVSREHIDWNQSTGQVSFDSKPLKGLLMAR